MVHISDKRLAISYKKFSKSIFEKFVKVSRFNFLFKFFFAVAFIVEVFFLISLLPMFSHSIFLAILIGAVLFTVFSFFVLYFYYEARKPEQFFELKERFLELCRSNSSIPNGAVEHHLSIAECALQFIHFLNGKEDSILVFPKFLSKFMQPISRFFHKEDLLKFKESFFYAAIEEYIQQIKSMPTDIEVHASLAGTYVRLAKLYQDSLSDGSYSRKILANVEERYQQAMQKAIEEYKIISDFAPNDPWVHAQLASSYHTLNLKKEETVEYEKILKFSPNDNEVKYRLGVLYFELGNHAQALKIYEDLLDAGFKKAYDLISCYGIGQECMIEQNDY
ncbi:MAG TPA: hypothetical protein P5048_02545 [Chlamydiales bacterium]|nr:hypothetical protein [Chlamydiales bacterium]